YDPHPQKPDSAVLPHDVTPAAQAFRGARRLEDPALFEEVAGGGDDESESALVCARALYRDERKLGGAAERRGGDLRRCPRSRTRLRVHLQRRDEAQTEVQGARTMCCRRVAG